jgi:hypothetical protein
VTAVAKARDVVVRFLSETRDFLRGADDVEQAYRDMARDADRAADAGEDAARDTTRAWDRAADSMRRDVDRASRDVRSDLGDAGTEAGDEFAQNLGESISSGDVSGLLAGTVGGLVGTFGKGGPIALALGAVGAVGVGAFQAIQAQAEQARTAAQLAFDQLREGASKEARLNAVLEDRFGTVVEGWERIQRYADASGKPVEVIADALANGGPLARDIADQWERAARAEYEAEGALGRSNSLLLDGVDDLRDRADALDRAAAAAQTERDALATSEGILRRSARYYSVRGSAYAPGGSTYQSQVPDDPYASGRRK